MSALDFEPLVRQLDAETKDWTAAAARGETPWICSDCGASFPGGMPDVCAYGHQSCTDIIARDKAAAALSAA